MPALCHPPCPLTRGLYQRCLMENSLKLVEHDAGCDARAFTVPTLAFWTGSNFYFGAPSLMFAHRREPNRPWAGEQGWLCDHRSDATMQATCWGTFVCPSVGAWQSRRAFLGRHVYLRSDSSSKYQLRSCQQKNIDPKAGSRISNPARRQRGWCIRPGSHPIPRATINYSGRIGLCVLPSHLSNVAAVSLAVSAASPYKS